MTDPTRAKIEGILDQGMYVTTELGEAITDQLVALVERESALKFIEHGWGPRCKTKDTDDFPELKDGNGRCAVCEMWDAYDEWRATDGK